MEVVLLLQYWMVVFVVGCVVVVVVFLGGRDKEVISRQVLQIREVIGKGDFGGELAWRSCYCCSMGRWFLLVVLFLGGGGEGDISRQDLEIG